MRHSFRHERPVLARFRRLSQLLLVIYLAAVHGLPALHLAWHKDDHVHELGGLRWLTAPQSTIRSTHWHTTVATHDAPAHLHLAQEPRTTHRLPSLRADDDRPLLGPALHLAIGAAHAQQSLITPAVIVGLTGSDACRYVSLASSVPVVRDLVAAPRARAPPELI